MARKPERGKGGERKKILTHFQLPPTKNCNHNEKKRLRIKIPDRNIDNQEKLKPQKVNER